MSTAGKILAFSKVRYFSSSKRNLTGGKIIFAKSSGASSSKSSVPNVQGLSENVVKVPKEPVGPGK